MSQQLIRSPKKLPEWFKSKNYDIPNSLNAWAYEFNARLFIKLSLNSKDRKKNEELLSFFLTNAAASSTIKPLYDYLDVENSVDDLTIFDLIALKTLVWDKKYEKISQSLEQGLHAHYEYILDNHPEEYLDNDLEDMIKSRALGSITESYVTESLDHEDDSSFDIFYKAAYHDVINLDHLIDGSLIINGIPITVDLSFDDQTLVDDFKSWLSKNRENSEKITKKPFAEKDIDEWRKYKILQVFDLDIWSRFNNINITDAAIAKALWPDDDPDAEDVSPIDRIRKTSRKKINELINPVSVRKLLAQSSVEQTRELNSED